MDSKLRPFGQRSRRTARDWPDRAPELTRPTRARGITTPPTRRKRAGGRRKGRRSDAEEGTERLPDADGPWHAHGRPVPLLLDARAPQRGAAGARLRARARQAARRTPRGVPRFGGQARPHRRVLRPPRRIAVVRPQRGMRPALPLSRLEVRHDRPVRGSALGAQGIGLRPEDQAEVLSADREGRRAVDLHGSRRKSSPRSPSTSSARCR